MIVTGVSDFSEFSADKRRYPPSTTRLYSPETTSGGRTFPSFSSEESIASLSINSTSFVGERSEGGENTSSRTLHFWFSDPMNGRTRVRELRIYAV